MRIQVERSIHYAAKALLNTAIAQLMLREGIGIDVVSLNELALVRHAGVDLARVHFHGNATPSAELAQAMAWGVGCLIIDNLSQLTSVIALSHRLQQPQAVMLRVAPDVVAGGHAHIQTGHKASKFGMPPDAIGSAIDQLNAAPGLQLIACMRISARKSATVNRWRLWWTACWILRIVNMIASDGRYRNCVWWWFSRSHLCHRAAGIDCCLLRQVGQQSH